MTVIQIAPQKRTAVRAAFLSLGLALAFAFTSGLPGDSHAASNAEKAKMEQQIKALDAEVRRSSTAAASSKPTTCFPSDYMPGVCPEALKKSCDKWGGDFSKNDNGSYSCTFTPKPRPKN